MIEPDAGLPVEPRRRRVLLVEDDSATGRGLSRLLEAEGFDVTVARDGSSALALLRDEPAPDFVLTDLQLPDADGREVARFARTLNPPPRVAVITGWDLDLSPEQCAQLGIEWVLAKPLVVPDLVAHLNTRQGASHSSNRPDEP